MHHFIILDLEIEWATSIFQNSCFPPCLKPNYIIYTSHSLIFPHLNPSLTFFLSFLFLCFFFSLGFESNHKSLISPSDTQVGLSIDCSWILQGWSTSCALFDLMKMVSSMNSNKKMYAPFIMQAHHTLENFFSYEKLVWTCI